MPLIDYPTGIRSLGMEEWSSAYICDWPNCQREADYEGYCEERFCQIEEKRRKDEDND